MSSNDSNTHAQEEGGHSIKFDIDTATEELSVIIDNISDMYHQLKKVKHNYLVHTNELFSRIDFPSLMMESAQREIKQGVPSTKALERMEF